jgi:hypothetical protein
MVIKGAASQSANLLEIQSSAGTVLSRFSSSGQFVSDQQTYIGSGATSISNTRLNVHTASASVIGQVIRGAASQSADLLQIQNSAGTNLVRADTYGGLFSTYATFTSDAAATRPLLVKGASGQSANLQEWQNSGGTVVANMQAGGNLKATNVATLNSLAQLAQANSGGVMIMGRQTAQYSSPGANSAALYFRDGTNAGTLKLVVRAGAAGAETTILDNIPT